MEQIGSWLVPVVVVLVLAAGTWLFATYVGRWIDSQGSSVITKPRERRKKSDRHRQ